MSSLFQMCAIGAQPFLRWLSLLLQPHLRRFLLPSQPLARHSDPSLRRCAGLHFRLLAGRNRHLPTTPRPPRPGPRPFLPPLPNPRPLPLHLLLLSPQLQVHQLLRHPPPWHCQPTNSHQDHPTPQKSKKTLSLLRQHDRRQHRKENGEHSPKCLGI